MDGFVGNPWVICCKQKRGEFSEQLQFVAVHQLVLLAASVMLEHDGSNENATWLLMLPRGKENKTAIAS